MHYPCGENKGADQLRAYREADLRLCFRICKKPVFSPRGSYSSKPGGLQVNTSFLIFPQNIFCGTWIYKIWTRRIFCIFSSTFVSTQPAPVLGSADLRCRLSWLGLDAQHICRVDSLLVNPVIDPLERERETNDLQIGWTSERSIFSSTAGSAKESYCSHHGRPRSHSSAVIFYMQVFHKSIS